MNIKRILAIILALMLALSLIACEGDAPDTDADTVDGSDSNTESDTDSDTEEQKVIETKTYKFTEILDSLKTHGRVYPEAEGLSCDYSSAGVEFNAYVEGKLTVSVKVSKGGADSMADDCYFTLYVDGERSGERLKAAQGTSTELTLGDFAEGGVHNFRLVRQTEARNALATISEVSFTGYFEDAPEAKEYFIEFMGASNTAGYGNLAATGSTATVAQKSENQDSTQSYTYLTAETLNADYSMLSVSGIGIVKGYRSYGIGKIFETKSYYRDTADMYKPVRTPDVIVMAVGSNDESKGTTLADYQKGAYDLIMQARMTYGGNVPIVWVYYTTDKSYHDAAKAAIDAVGGEESGIYEIQLNFNKLGGNNHPDLASHKEQAAELTKFIVEKNILN